MKKTITLLLTMLMGITAWADIPDGYYRNAVGKSDEALMTALEGIIYTHSLLGYNFLWDCYPYTDAGDDGYYIDMYSTCKYNHDTYHPGNASYVGQGLNREHSFPKSWFGGEVSPMFTDLTMIIPADAYVNQRRSNYPYGVCAGGITYTTDSLGVSMLGKLGKSTYNGYSERVFEPDDEYKGDFARIYFYMVTCYKSVVGTWPGCDQLDYETNGYKAFSSWSMQMLMEWHRADPVSPKEIARNEAVYKSIDHGKDYGQGNRNPFVDHPELAEYIWGTKQHETWTDGTTPPDTIVKIDPVMLPVDTTAVTGHAFRADWTSGGDVSSYTLKVNPHQDSGATLLMTETFSKVNASADGKDDIGTQLDTFTDNPGWTGYKVYTAANHSLKLGTSTVAGYLITPELQLGQTVSVVVNAKNWINSSGVSDGSSMVVSCGNVSQTVMLSDTPADYTIVLDGCTESKVKISMTAAKKRFYVYNVEVYNGDVTAPRREIVEQGDSTWRMVSGIADTCYTVKALQGGTYGYTVKAIYTDGTESVWSNIQLVTLTGIEDLLIGDVNNDGFVDISDATALINYLLSGDASDLDLEAADVAHDGMVDISDATALINYLLNGNW
ncbi:MAG: endonuclease [Muribaculaceae bacterium]|nr:endonuclease [Muribaculaceae bacterium]